MELVQNWEARSFPRCFAMGCVAFPSDGDLLNDVKRIRQGVDRRVLPNASPEILLRHLLVHPCLAQQYLEEYFVL